MQSVVDRRPNEIDVVDVERDELGRLTMVAVKMVESNGTDPFGAIAERLKGEIGANTQNLNQLQIILRMYVDAGPGSAQSEDVLRVNEINGEKIEELMKNISQSGEEAVLYDMVFVADIIRNGFSAAGKTTKPSWWPRTCLPILWNTPDHLNCMLFSLVYLKWGVLKRYSAFPGRAVKKCFEMQMMIEWGIKEPITRLAEIIKMDEFKTNQIIVVVGMSNLKKPIPQCYVFQGEDFEPVLKKCIRKDEKGNDREFEEETEKHKLYLYYDVEKEHIAGINHMVKLVDSKHHNYTWCHKCLYATEQGKRHYCDGRDEKRIISEAKKQEKKMTQQCQKCGVFGDHRCPFKSCQQCSAKYKYDEAHRCILFQKERTEERNNWVQSTEVVDGKFPSLWAYDFECKIVKTRLPISKYTIESFAYDENGRLLKGEDNYISGMTLDVDEHVVNFVYCKNVFTGEERFFGENESLDGGLTSPMQRFINFACEYNNGHNTFAAHNARNYDSRLLLHHMYKCKDESLVEVIKNGQMLLDLKIGFKNKGSKRTTFIDTLSHLPGSLKKLAKDMCGDKLAKGYFPHRFNSAANYNYNGLLPAKEYFDIYFSAKNQKDVDEFDKWWEERNKQGEWNFMREMKFYNRNDVEVLAEIMKKYHEIMMKDSGMSPWFNMTGPSYCHEVTLIEGMRKLNDQYELEKLKKEYPKSYQEKITEIAKNEYWAVKKPVEYAPVKKAFRGGRTEIVAMYARLTQEEIENGVEIRAADICSSYPAQQIKQKFPIGLPKIRVWDPDYRPCKEKECKGSLTRVKCTHPTEKRRVFGVNSKLERGSQPTAKNILDEDWNGYVCVTIQPCKMIHPIIPHKDEKLNKCLFSCEKLVECWVDTPTLKTALKAGYVLEKVFAFHEYKMEDSLWAESTMRRFIGKMINSCDEPENLNEIAQKYEDKFGEEFGDRLRNTSGSWGNNPALRAVMKTAANCGWGKHAQTITQSQNMIIHDEKDTEKLNELLLNVVSKNYKLKRFETVYQNTRSVDYIANEENVAANLHKVALDAAAFVPAYGRLQLWEQLDKLEKDNPGVTPRVFNMDTDSIYYKWYPEHMGIYNIPENDMLSGWERDDDASKGGIVEIVCLGPKTYSYKCKNGWVSPPKTKGVRLGYSTEKIINFNSFKQTALEQLSYCERNQNQHLRKKAKHMLVQQTGFMSKKGKLLTVRSLKKLGVDVDGMKRDLRSNGYLYPFGYDEAPERVEMVGDWDGLNF